MNASTPSERNAVATVNDPRWRAVLQRERSADGHFVYSVRTTGVYCRPSCAARQARPENVRFHASADDAERAGFRPCKRCNPRGRSRREEHGALITALCRLIEQADAPIGLNALAKVARLSPYHLHRVFKAATGLTPRQYAGAKRTERVRGALSSAANVTEAIYDAGYASSGRFYAQSNKVLGMTPTQYRAGGRDMLIHFAIGKCSLGNVLAASTLRGVCAIHLGDDAKALVAELRARFPQATITASPKTAKQTLRKVIAMIEAPNQDLGLPLDIRGTAFQQRVWQALRDIPAGKTFSYSALARQLGAPRSVRAVASACAANALAVAIPCHRVLRNDGSISGYRWGVERKRALLRREAGE